MLFGGLDGRWSERGLFCCSLSQSLTPALWRLPLSSERRRTRRTPKVNSWHFLEGSSTSAIVRRQRPAPANIVQPRTGWRHARQQTHFLFFFGMCDDSLSSTTAGDGTAKWIKTIVLSSPFSSTSNRRTALKLGTRGLQGLRNTLVKNLEIYLRQKSRFSSVHASQAHPQEEWICKEEQDMSEGFSLSFPRTLQDKPNEEINMCRKNGVKARPEDTFQVRGHRMPLFSINQGRAKKLLCNARTVANYDHIFPSSDVRLRGGGSELVRLEEKNRYFQFSLDWCVLFCTASRLFRWREIHAVRTTLTGRPSLLSLRPRPRSHVDDVKTIGMKSYLSSW